MSLLNHSGSYSDSFKALYPLSQKHLGEFASVDAAGKAASAIVTTDKDTYGGAKLSFEFEGFSKAIRGVCIAGKHGYFCFTEDGDVTLSRSYSTSDLWTDYPNLRELLVKSLLVGLPMMTWTDLLDMDFVNHEVAQKWCDSNLSRINVAVAVARAA